MSSGTVKTRETARPNDDARATLAARWNETKLFLTRKAKVHHPENFYRLRSIPGVGKILAMTILYEIRDIARFERVQNSASYARRVKCEMSSSGKRLGTGGGKIGNVHLKWAFSEAAVLFLRANPPAQEYIETLRKKHGKAKSLSILAHKLGRAVYHMMKNKKLLSRSVSNVLTGNQQGMPDVELKPYQG